MTSSAIHGLLDEAHRVRLAALSLATSLRAAHPTAVQLRSQWLRLATTYCTPEADLVLRGMDRPAARAEELGHVAALVHDALLTYADQLGELARRPASTAAEALVISEARAAAEWSCATALRAIPRPEQRSSDEATTYHHRQRVHPASEPPAGHHNTGRQLFGTLRAGSITPQSAPTERRWAHPEESSVTSLTHFIDQWAGLTPPDGDDPRSHTLHAFNLLGLGGATTADWMITVEHGTFRPRGAAGRYVSRSSLSTAQRLAAGAGSVSQRQGLTITERLRTFIPAGTFEAKGGRGPAHKHWTTVSSRWGRANTVVTVATSGWGAWQQNSGSGPAERIGRTATQGAAVAAGAVAGAKGGALIGSAIGTAIAPGAGTLVGATVGGLVGGFAGSELGGWVGRQVVDVDGEARDLLGDSLEWVSDRSRDAGPDFVDTVMFWA